MRKLKLYKVTTNVNSYYSRFTDGKYVIGKNKSEARAHYLEMFKKQPQTIREVVEEVIREVGGITLEEIKVQGFKISVEPLETKVNSK